ncbi:MAG: Uma2 family endonuclease [Planctomycetota bacterium]
MSTLATPKATLADLMTTEGKAELIGGRIVRLMSTGRRPNRIAFRIARSLDDFCEANQIGEAYSDNIGYAVPELASGRESFSPDASVFLGSPPENDMGFLEGPPAFAAEVRSENNYGPAAESAIAAKRADYFEAGTKVVWDVDPIANVIRSYEAHSPERPILFAIGQHAHANSALPGWSIDVEAIFRQ